MNFVDNNIAKNLSEIIENDKNLYKFCDKKNPSIIIKPLLTFFYWYIIKGAIFEGVRGYLFSKMKYFEDFILECMKHEGQYKGETYDI